MKEILTVRQFLWLETSIESDVDGENDGEAVLLVGDLLPMLEGE